MAQERLYHGEEKTKFGDSACQSKEKKRISPSQRKRTHQTSGIRSFVEHPFQVLKRQWHHRKVRYRGLRKNGLQFTNR